MSRRIGKDRELPTVILIEDDTATATLLAELLRDMGHEAHPFARTEDALAAAASLEPDLVISDLWIANARDEAWATLQSLRTTVAPTPVLVLTGHTAALIDGEHHGFSVLLKPFDVEEFEQVVNGMLASKQET